MTLAEYLAGKNKAAFARAIGLKHSQSLHALLPGKNGQKPRRTLSAALAKRIVAATDGAVTYEDLFGRGDVGEAA